MNKMIKKSKIVVTTFGIFAFATASFAQTLPVDLGINVGGNLNFININGEKPSVGLLPGYQVGVFAQISPKSVVGKFFAFNAGLMYVNNNKQQCGTATTAATMDGTTATSSDCNLSETPAAGRMVLKTTNGYLTAPLTFQFKPFKGFSVNVGPQISYLLSSIASGKAAFQRLNGSVDVQNLAYNYLSDQAGQAGGAYASQLDSTRRAVSTNGSLFNRTDLGINLGFSIQLTKRLGVDLRTNYGLMDVVNDVYQSRTAATTTNRNVTGQVNVTYLLFGSSFPKKSSGEVSFVFPKSLPVVVNE